MSHLYLSGLGLPVIIPIMAATIVAGGLWFRRIRRRHTPGNVGVRRR